MVTQGQDGSYFSRCYIISTTFPRFSEKTLGSRLKYRPFFFLVFNVWTKQWGLYSSHSWVYHSKSLSRGVIYLLRILWFSKYVMGSRDPMAWSSNPGTIIGWNRRQRTPFPHQIYHAFRTATWSLNGRWDSSMTMLRVAPTLESDIFSHR